MNISHFRFVLFNLKIFGEIVTTLNKTTKITKIKNIARYKNYFYSEGNKIIILSRIEVNEW